MIVKVMVDAVAKSAGATTNSEVFDFHMPKGNRGLVMYMVSGYGGSGNITCKLQGRTNADMDFVDVGSTSKNISSNTVSSQEDIQLFPQMRAEITTAAGASGTVSVHVGG